MDRRMVIGTLAGALLAASLPAKAQPQPAKIYRIGFLGSTSAAEFTSRVDALRAGLRDLGYVEGKNLVIEYRWADGNFDQLAELAAELVALKVDVLVTHGDATRVANRATTTIPIVVAIGGDFVATGLAASLARPGGNVTGQTALPELGAKRLALLAEAVPSIRKVAVLMRRGSATLLQPVENAARSVNVALQRFEVDGPNEFASAFLEMARARVDAVEVSEEPMLIAGAKVVAQLAAKQQLPSAGFAGLAEAGGLIGYGVDALELFRRTAIFVDKILRGAKPGDLPIEQPTKFRLIINLKTAKALGLTIPNAVLVRADELIQ